MLERQRFLINETGHISALRGTRSRPAHRCNHRKSVIQNQRRSSQPMPVGPLPPPSPRSQLRRVFILERLSDDEMQTILTRALARGSSSNDNETTGTSDTSQGDTPTSPLAVSQAARVNNRILRTIVALSVGDSRTALSLLELCLSASASTAEDALIQSLKRSVAAGYDRSGDDRYDLISALHKSVRGSDGSAALYWLARHAISVIKCLPLTVYAACSPVGRIHSTLRAGAS